MAGVLVIGASGLIGRAVLAEGRAGLGGDMVHALVSRPDGAPSGARLQPLDREGAAPLAELIRDLQPRAVVNAAGRTDGDADALRAANVVVVETIIDAMRQAGVDVRLVHIGSAAEYAPLPAGQRTGEEVELTGGTPYASTKVAASRLVLEAAAGDADAVVARVFNPIGSGLPPESLPGRAARLLLDAVARGERSIELGPLDAVRDYIDLRDVAAGILRLATADHLAHRAYNVGSGQGTLVRDLVRLIARRAGFDGDVRETGAGSARSAAVGHQVADVGRLRGEGWAPAFDLPASVDALLSGIRTDAVAPAP